MRDCYPTIHLDQLTETLPTTTYSCMRAFDSQPSLGSPITSGLSASQKEDDSHRPSRIPDLSFLSANFSSESLDIQGAASPTTPVRSGLGPAIPPSNNLTPAMTSAQLLAYNRLNSNANFISAQNSPGASLSQPSFSSHQRTYSNSSSRPRPRSMFGSELQGSAILEGADESADSRDKRAQNRNSFHYTPKMSNTPMFTPRSQEGIIVRSRSNSPKRATSPKRSSSPQRRAALSPYRSRASSPSKQPFNFKPQDVMNGGSAAKPAHRKGHRYKHSSVSMNLFQEPLPIDGVNLQQNLIPDLYPIPNIRESLASADSFQKLKLMFAFFHFLVSGLVFWFGVESQQPAFSTLSHLVFYDSLGSILVAFVDIMSNFEAWSKSSIAYPFGLGRLEVLTGFALSASLVMVGCDLVSHFVEELVVSYVEPLADEHGSHEHGSHHIHGSNHPNVNWFFYELVLLVVILVTWLTSTMIFADGAFYKMIFKVESNPQSSASQSKATNGLLDKHEGKADSKLSYAKRLLGIFVKNPIRLLTLLYSLFLFLVPLIPSTLKEEFGFDINETSTLMVAFTLCYAGWSLLKTLGGILLISFPYSDYDYNVLKATIIDKILGLPSFKNSYVLGSFFFTKVNYQLYVVGVTVTMKGGSADEESRLLFEINRVIVNELNRFEEDAKVETTVSVDRA